VENFVGGYESTEYFLLQQEEEEQRRRRRPRRLQQEEEDNMLRPMPPRPVMTEGFSNKKPPPNYRGPEYL
jgi:hypothetical protein